MTFRAALWWGLFSVVCLAFVGAVKSRPVGGKSSDKPRTRISQFFDNSLGHLVLINTLKNKFSLSNGQHNNY